MTREELQLAIKLLADDFVHNAEQRGDYVTIHRGYVDGLYAIAEDVDAEEKRSRAVMQKLYSPHGVGNQGPMTKKDEAEQETGIDTSEPDDKAENDPGREFEMPPVRS